MITNIFLDLKKKINNLYNFFDNSFSIVDLYKFYDKLNGYLLTIYHFFIEGLITVFTGIKDLFNYLLYLFNKIYLFIIKIYNFLLDFFTYKKFWEDYNFLCNTRKTFQESFYTIINSDNVTLEHNILLLLIAFFIFSLIKLIFSLLFNFLVTLFIFFFCISTLYLFLKKLCSFIYTTIVYMYTLIYTIIKPLYKWFYYITGKIINYIREFDLNSSFFTILTKFENDNEKLSEFLKNNPNFIPKDYYKTINKKKALINYTKHKIKDSLYKKYPRFYYDILIGFKIVDEEAKYPVKTILFPFSKKVENKQEYNNSGFRIKFKKNLIQKSTLGITKEMVYKKESIINERHKKNLVVTIFKNVRDNLYKNLHNRFNNIKVYIYGSGNYYKKKDFFINHELENNIWKENRLYLKNYHKVEKQSFWFYFKLVFFFIFYTFFLFIGLIKFFLSNEILLLKNTIFLNLISDSFLFLVSGGFISILFYTIYDLLFLLLIYLKFLSDSDFTQFKKNLKSYIFIDSYFIRTFFLNIRVITLFFILFYVHYLLIGQNKLSIDISLIIKYVFNYTFFFLNELFISFELNTYFNESIYNILKLCIKNIISILVFIKKNIIASLLITIRLTCFFLSIYWVYKIIVTGTNDWFYKKLKSRELLYTYYFK